MTNRLFFGGTGCPFIWCPVGELITDLSNDIVNDFRWEPPSSIIDSTPVPFNTDIHDEDGELLQTLPKMHLPPPRPDGSHDVYVVNTMGIMLHTPRNRRRAPLALIAATNAIIRPNMSDEPI
jgi:hypothetical protein